MSTGSSITCAQFKKAQLDHLINVILESSGDSDHAAQRIANDYPTTNVQDYTNIECNELDNMNLTRSRSNDQVIISSALKKQILSSKGFWQSHNCTLSCYALQSHLPHVPIFLRKIREVVMMSNH